MLLRGNAYLSTFKFRMHSHRGRWERENSRCRCGFIRTMRMNSHLQIERDNIKGILISRLQIFHNGIGIIRSQICSDPHM